MTGIAIVGKLESTRVEAREMHDKYQAGRKFLTIPVFDIRIYIKKSMILLNIKYVIKSSLNIQYKDVNTSPLISSMYQYNQSRV
jgi:hypothetical protein